LPSDNAIGPHVGTAEHLMRWRVPCIGDVGVDQTEHSGLAIQSEKHSVCE
jgi:hypothetical protein